jgi:MFS family permease
MRPWHSPNVRWIGVTSLLADAGSEMVAPFLPSFLTGVLGAAPAWVGLVEGAAEAMSSVLKLVAGRITDKFGQQGRFVVAGYALAAAARPLIGLATSPLHVLGIRLVDRVGKGLRTTPRDALLAGAVPPEQRGEAFGFHRTMDNLGAVIGPLLALILLQLLSGDLTRMFLLAAIPGALSVLAATQIRDGAAPAPAAAQARLGAPPPPLRPFLVPLTLFLLGRAGESLVLLRAGGASVDIVRLPLTWMAYSAVKAAASTPLGAVADRLGHRNTIVIGWIWYGAVAAGFALTSSVTASFLLLLGYALYLALCEGVEKAYVADLCASERGTAFGWYHLVVGLSSLAGSTTIGLVWTHGSSAAAFGGSSAIAITAALALAATRRTPSTPGYSQAPK